MSDFGYNSDKENKTAYSAINTPLSPTSIKTQDGNTMVQCGNCGFVFEKAPRCPECGQLVLYKERWNKPKLKSYKEWEQVSQIHGATTREVVEFLERMILKENFSYHVGAVDLSLDYRVSGDKKRLQLLMLFGGDSYCCAIQPSSYYDYFEYKGLGSEIVDEFLVRIKPFLSKKQKNVPYENKKGYYFIDYATLVDKAKDIEVIFDWLNSTIAY